MRSSGASVGAAMTSSLENGGGNSAARISALTSALASPDELGGASARSG